MFQKASESVVLRCFEEYKETPTQDFNISVQLQPYQSTPTSPPSEQKN